MRRRWALRGLLILGLGCAWGADAHAEQPSGDPFVAPIPLAGTWYAFGGDLEADEATTTDVAKRWHPLEIPGTLVGTKLEGRHGITWYGLDVSLSGTATTSKGDLAIVLPPFMKAYEVFINGESVGGSGTIAPMKRGPNRPFVYPIPRNVITPELAVRIRTHDNEHKGGTFSGARAVAMAVGRPKALEQLMVLSRHELQSAPKLVIQRFVQPMFIGVALLQLVIFLLDRRRRALGWYAAMLLVAVAAGRAQTAVIVGDLGADALTQIGVDALNVAATSLLWKTVSVLLDQSGRLPKLAITLPWSYILVMLIGYAVGAPTAPAVGLFRNIVWPLSIFAGLLLILRGWRAKHPDARVLVLGFGAATVLALASALLFQAADSRAFGGHLAPIRAAVDFAASVALLVTTGIALALRYHRGYVDLERAHVASERFVPAAFLELLGRRDVVAVERGDSSAREMTVMFSDIRGFTRLSERRTPDGNFAFINRYLERMEPCITGNHGFVNQFYGDGIMALFPTADDALRAARSMQQSIDRLNDELERESQPKLQVGIGLHTGPLMLGTIGGSERLDTGVIGDAVNLSARVEGMTKQYGCRVLLSGATRSALLDASDFELREIDRNQAVGRNEAVVVHQLLDAEDEETIAHALATRERFERGLEAYRTGAFDVAVEAFEAVASAANDGAAKLLLRRSRELEANAPAEWNGVTVLDGK